MLNSKGFTIVEMVVVMAVFIGLMLISSYAFENIIAKGGQQLRSVESNTEGIVGLEMLRSDIEHAGYGLPWTFPFTPGTFPEVAASANPVNGITSSSFNDQAPRGICDGFAPAGATILAGTSNTNPGVDYLVIKSSRVALNDTVRKWAYVNYATTPPATNTSFVNNWGTTDDFAVGERVITISSTFTSTGEPDRRLMMVNATQYSYAMPAAPPVQPPDDAYKPGDGSQLYVVYGVDPGSNLRMPYNRADYYVRRPAANMPESCNPGTGVLYKGVVQQGTTSPGGTFVEYPLLNCVGDLQADFELDPNGDGNIAYSNSLTGLTAPAIRTELKTARVYILAHEGKKDRNYRYQNDTIQVGDPARPASSGRTWDSAGMAATFGPDWRNYRWKVYTIVGRPKNLN